MIKLPRGKILKLEDQEEHVKFKVLYSRCDSMQIDADVHLHMEQIKETVLEHMKGKLVNGKWRVMTFDLP